MTKKKICDPYVEILDAFNHKGIDYVVVGMSGINYYASQARDTFVTQDYDIFVKPAIDNIKKVISVFEKQDYSLATGTKKLDKRSVKDIVKDRKTIIAVDPYGIAFDLILAVSGYTFSQMQRGAKIFKVGNIPIKVAKLSKLLMSKKVAGREKDRLFLKRYELILKEKEG
ncbi:MAG: hypothetical protein ABH875_06540 [Candidatus Omnitrophota bacterium]